MRRAAVVTPCDINQKVFFQISVMEEMRESGRLPSSKLPIYNLIIVSKVGRRFKWKAYKIFRIIDKNGAYI